MKHLGMLAVLIGTLLLIRPDFNGYDFLETCSYLLIGYWPVLLIVFGVFLQSKAKIKHRR